MKKRSSFIIEKIEEKKYKKITFDTQKSKSSILKRKKSRSITHMTDIKKIKNNLNPPYEKKKKEILFSLIPQINKLKEIKNQYNELLTQNSKAKKIRETKIITLNKNFEEKNSQQEIKPTTIRKQFLRSKTITTPNLIKKKLNAKTYDSESQISNKSFNEEMDHLDLDEHIFKEINNERDLTPMPEMKECDNLYADKINRFSKMLRRQEYTVELKKKNISNFFGKRVILIQKTWRRYFHFVYLKNIIFIQKVFRGFYMRKNIKDEKLIVIRFVIKVKLFGRKKYFNYFIGQIKKLIRAIFFQHLLQTKDTYVQCDLDIPLIPNSKFQSSSSLRFLDERKNKNKINSKPSSKFTSKKNNIIIHMNSKNFSFNDFNEKSNNSQYSFSQSFESDNSIIINFDDDDILEDNKLEIKKNKKFSDKLMICINDNFNLFKENKDKKIDKEVYIETIFEKMTNLQKSVNTKGIKTFPRPYLEVGNNLKILQKKFIRKNLLDEISISKVNDIKYSGNTSQLIMDFSDKKTLLKKIQINNEKVLRELNFVKIKKKKIDFSKKIDIDKMIRFEKNLEDDLKERKYFLKSKNIKAEEYNILNILNFKRVIRKKVINNYWSKYSKNNYIRIVYRRLFYLQKSMKKFLNRVKVKKKELRITLETKLKLFIMLLKESLLKYFKREIGKKIMSKCKKKHRHIKSSICVVRRALNEENFFYEKIKYEKNKKLKTENLFLDSESVIQNDEDIFIFLTNDKSDSEFFQRYNLTIDDLDSYH